MQDYLCQRRKEKKNVRERYLGKNCLGNVLTNFVHGECKEAILVEGRGGGGQDKVP